MALTNSQPNNINVPSGNGLVVYIDGENNKVYVRDVRGATEELNVLTGSITDIIVEGGLTALQSGNTITLGTDASIIQLKAEKGQPNGYASLDASGKLPVSELPVSVLTYEGMWNADTNTPTLVDGTGNAGDFYIVSVAGTQDLGDGPIEFEVGDWVIYNGAEWQRNSSNLPDLQEVTDVGSVTTNAITTGGITTDFVQLDLTATPTLTVGMARWNPSQETWEVGIGDGPVAYEMGQSLYYPQVRNTSGGSLPKGALVMVDPTDVATGDRLNVVRAIANGTYPSQLFVGILAQNIASNETGFAVWFGQVQNASNSAINLGEQTWTEGQILYADPANPGGLTNVEPTAPNLKVTIAAIQAINGNNINLLVRPWLNEDIGQLNDVSITNPDDNSILQFNSTTGVWEDVAGTTTNIAEGTNLYFTTARARESVSATDGLAYNSSTGVFTNIDKGSSQDIFKNIAVATQSTVTADTNNDTLTLAAGTNIAITTNATTDTITIATTGVPTGTGIANYVALWSSASNLSTSQIYDNGTAVGIATATPSSLLQIGNTTDQKLNFDFATANEVKMIAQGYVFTIANTPSNSAFPSALLLQATSNSGVIQLTAASNTTTYTSTGLFAINATGGDSTKKLYVNGNAIVGNTSGTTPANFEVSDYVAGVSETIGLRNRADNATGRGTKISFKTGGSPFAEKGSISVTAIDGNRDGYNMAFGTTATGGTISTKLTLLGSGAVQLNLYGSGTYTGTAAYNLAVDASGNIIETAGSVIDGSGTTNYLSKFTDSNTIGDSQVFDNGTNVGIGTTSPSQLLHVNGAVRITGSLYDSTNDPGSVTEFLSSTGSGTAWATAVTSVALSVPTGFGIANSPVTTTGTLALSFATGYSLPTDARQTEWDNAYNDSITAFAYNTGTALLTLTQRDLGTLTTTITLQPFTTTNLVEGTNLYYTDARARAAVSAGTGISYDNLTGVITNSDRGSSQNIFKNISVAGQNLVVAESNDDTLTLVAGTNITITTDATTDTITINSTDQFVGTVTSVAMSVPTGFNIGGSPITTSGTLGLTFASGYSLPTNASQSNWDTAYNDSITAFGYNTGTGLLTLTQQDLGTLTASITLQPFTTTNLTEGTNLYFTDARARASLSAGTGISYDNGTGVVSNSDRGSSQNIFKNVAVTGSDTIVADTNDDTITFTAGSGVTLASNATNDTITISATGLGGTVTSVSLTAPTGFTVSGSPITTSGTLSIGFDTGYSLPTTASQANWDDAYNNKITAVSFNSGTLTLTQQDTGTLSTSLDGRYILLTEKGANNGVATLDAGGKIPASQLPSSVFEYKGTWNAATNTPTLVDGVGDPGDVYLVSTAGTHDFGDGPISFAVGDLVLYDGAEWQKSSSTNDVLSVNGQTGVVVLTTTNIGEGTNLYFTDARARSAISGGTGINYNSTTGTITNSDLGSSQNIFKNIEVAGQSTVTAEINNDTLTLVAGTNISITTNASTDTITINSTDQFIGTVTSVAMSVPTGFAISGSPITSSGTLGLSFATGYSLPTNASQSNWDTAYNNSITNFGYNTSNGVLTLTQQDAGTLTATITLQPFSTTNLTEGTNLYFTDARARASLASGDGISYNSTTGVITNSDRGSSQAIFKNIEVSGQSTIVADSNNDSLTLVAGTNISITTNATTDTITINSTDQFVGTVTSVDMSVPTGFTISGNPITSAGTLNLAFASGYSLPTNASQSNWDTAYNNSITNFGYNTSNGVLTLTQQDAGTLTATVTLQPFSTTNLAEGTNLYFTDARARTAISLTTSGTSGAATYNNTTGVFNIPQYQAALANPVTGTGTTNYVAKWSSSSAITDSLIFDNGTSVGISNATPGEKLDITGNARVSSYYLFNGNPGNPGDSSASIYDQAAVGPTISGLNVAFRAGSTPAEIMRVSSTGVLIGTTTSSGEALTVYGASEGAVIFQNSTSGTGSGNGLYLGVLNSENYLWTYEAQPLIFGTNSAEQVRITSAGLVGIGTSSPTGKLTISQANSGGVAAILLTEDESTIQGPSGNTQIRMGSNLVLGGANIMTFGTSGSERMRLTADGTLQVGTTSQTYNNSTYGYVASFKGAITSQAYISVALSNQASTSEGMLFGLTSTAGEIYVLDNKPLVLSTNSTEKMRIAAGGNVLIGTTTDAGYKLDVNGSLRATTGVFTIEAGTPLQVYQTNATNQTTAVIRQTTAGGNGNQDIGLLVDIQGAGDTDRIANFRYYDGSTYTSRMAIMRGGNVGIGTTSPITKLDVLDGTIAAGNSTNVSQTNTLFQGYGYFIGSTRYGLVGLHSTYNNANNRSTLDFYTTGSTGYNQKMSISTEGVVRLNAYGSGGITGTPTYNLAVDANGDIIELPGGVVDGSGTANYVTKWQDANTVTNSSITDDGTTVTALVNRVAMNQQAGIYVFPKSVGPSAAVGVFEIKNQHGAQALRVSFVCSTTSYSVAKTYEVVHCFAVAPVYSKVVDTGPFSGEDFNVAFTNNGDNTGLVATITNNSTTLTANIVATVFLGGSSTTITITAL